MRISKESEQNLQRELHKLEGTEIHSNNLLQNIDFISKAIASAKSYEWLYHCTNSTALFSIIHNRELWLSSLKCVNDKEEVGRIDVPEYENGYYVGCFTHDANISKEHWEEYGSPKDGILIGFKREWVIRSATFMTLNNFKCPEIEIFDNCKMALNEKINQCEQYNRITNPFFINDFEFYKVVYGDKLKKNIEEDCSVEIDGRIYHGRSYMPSIAGIVKSKYGICSRQSNKQYEKDWTTEKEVRLKVAITQLDNSKNGYPIHDGTIMSDVYFPKIAVKLSDIAFKYIKIKFSPGFSSKEDYIKRLKQMIPMSSVEEIV